MNPISALIVDDEEHSRASVRMLLGTQPRWRILGECEHGAARRSALARAVPDVVLRDIRLPDHDGIALARLLLELKPRPLVVFTTAYEWYAVDAFEVQAFDYLLKPFDDARFLTAVRRIEEALPLASGATPYVHRLVIRSIGRVQLVDVAGIDWLEASGNYVEVHAGKDRFLHRERLHVLEAQLDPARFVRIHRSIIVNRAAVAEIRPIAGGDYSIVSRSGARLRLSRTYRSALASFERGS
ncbi:MAG: LytR/AlgR family response regulator transcription factor [Gemmatimonadaceae bacterium]